MRMSDGTIRKFRRSFDEAGSAHELTFSCCRGLPLLSKNRTRQWLVEAIDAARCKLDLTLWGYVIMPEHVHLLLSAPQGIEVAKVLQTIKQPVARKAIAYLRLHSPDWLNKLRVSTGATVYHFWQPGGGYDRMVVSTATAWASIAYMHENPVKRRLVPASTDWPWSSARWYAGLSEVVLAMDGRPPDVQRL